ncbi:hypothetical protein [Bacillus sp. REN16]|nr:hypothetical protein [Bacillus sp. REN16]MCC3358954.1 hypothetical protein [Bacillus sp. REN16]
MGNIIRLSSKTKPIKFEDRKKKIQKESEQIKDRFEKLKKKRKDLFE